MCQENLVVNSLQKQTNLNKQQKKTKAKNLDTVRTKARQIKTYERDRKECILLTYFTKGSLWKLSR
ncbi:MAG: Unknown protein [uncultured Sulfurovum sp.]|uniref:Uncharacterized protein n=1 Tax=uncultured Sulfurovum sp. TaxID=269237 RepID=A0A6S6T435_9BACT|nr:MAG: Unknown protein [uncultured Sulfurovum sp.]